MIIKANSFSNIRCWSGSKSDSRAWFRLVSWSESWSESWSSSWARTWFFWEDLSRSYCWSQDT